MSTSLVHGNITLTAGRIIVGGSDVGAVERRLRHGYHPMLRVVIGTTVTWFELDTPSLVDRVFEVVAAKVPGVVL